MELRDYQKEGVKFLKENKYALLADDMGLGKTAQALNAVDTASPYPSLIICPANVRDVWESEIGKWKPDYESAKLLGPSLFFRLGPLLNLAEKISHSFYYDFLIVSYTSILNKQIREFLAKIKFNTLILDEAHYLKNPKSKRTKAILGKKGLVRNCEKAYLLTGTPMSNRPVELWPMLSVFVGDKLGKYRTYWEYAKRYCNAYESKWGWDVSGASNLEELKEKLEGFMLRRTRAEVLTELPKATIQHITVEPDKEMKDIIEYEKKYKDMDAETLLDNYAKLGDLVALRQKTALRKLELVKSYLVDVARAKDKLIIFAYHRRVIHEIHEVFKYWKIGAVRFYGDMTAKDKTNSLNSFINDDKTKVFIGNILSAGTGLDGLQKVADTMLFVEWTWTPGQLLQAIGRLHRMGQKKNVLAQFLYCKDTVEEKMLKVMLSKSKVIEKVLDV